MWQKVTIMVERERREKYLWKQGDTSEEVKWRDNRVKHCCQWIWSPKTVDAVSHLKARANPSKPIPCRAVPREQNLEVTFRPSLVLQKCLIQWSWSNTYKSLSFRIVIHRFPSQALNWQPRYHVFDWTTISQAYLQTNIHESQCVWEKER